MNFEEIKKIKFLAILLMGLGDAKVLIRCG
jgi:hypothetical protein